MAAATPASAVRPARRRAAATRAAKRRAQTSVSRPTSALRSVETHRPTTDAARARLAKSKSTPARDKEGTRLVAVALGAAQVAAAVFPAKSSARSITRAARISTLHSRIASFVTSASPPAVVGSWVARIRAGNHPPATRLAHAAIQRRPEILKRSALLARSQAPAPTRTALATTRSLARVSLAVSQRASSARFERQTCAARTVL